jgi:hypothetical protein
MVWIWGQIRSSVASLLGHPKFGPRLTVKVRRLCNDCRFMTGKRNIV